MPISTRPPGGMVIIENYLKAELFCSFTVQQKGAAEDDVAAVLSLFVIIFILFY